MFPYTCADPYCPNKTELEKEQKRNLNLQLENDSLRKTVNRMSEELSTLRNKQHERGGDKVVRK